MIRRRASPRQLRLLAVSLCVFALLLWGIAFFLNPNRIVVNGRVVTRDDPSFRHSMIIWRLLMSFGGLLSLFMARLCQKIARGKGT